jgi:hypothetical protein
MAQDPSLLNADQQARMDSLDALLGDDEQMHRVAKQLDAIQLNEFMLQRNAAGSERARPVVAFDHGVVAGGVCAARIRAPGHSSGSSVFQRTA